MNKMFSIDGKIAVIIGFGGVLIVPYGSFAERSQKGLAKTPTGTFW